MNRKYTSEHIEFFRENTLGRTCKELTALFNKRFGTNLPVSTVMSASFRCGFKTGRGSKFNKGYEPTRFKKGNIPFNKGTKGVMKVNKTSFKKGNVPKNYRPVGSERINTDGYTDVKIADHKKWKSKHIIIWEGKNGTVPKGHVVIFADGNKQNFSLDNLVLISRSQLAVMNKRGLIFNSTELTKVGVVMADVIIKIGEQKRRGKTAERK